MQGPFAEVGVETRGLTPVNIFGILWDAEGASGLFTQHQSLTLVVVMGKSPQAPRGVGGITKGKETKSAKGHSKYISVMVRCLQTLGHIVQIKYLASTGHQNSSNASDLYVSESTLDKQHSSKAYLHRCFDHYGAGGDH